MATNAVEGAEVDEDVDQGVAIGNGLEIAEFGAFNTEGLGLSIDAFVGGALVVEFYVAVAVTVELIAETSTNTGR